MRRRMSKEELQQAQKVLSRKNVDSAEIARSLYVFFWIFPVSILLGAFAWSIFHVPLYLVAVVVIIFTSLGVLFNHYFRNFVGGFSDTLYMASSGYHKKVYDHGKQQALIMQGKFEEARQLYEITLRGEPEDIEGHFELARLYIDYLDQFAEAIKVYRRAQQIPKILDEHYIYISRSIADLYYQKMGEYDKAIAEYRRIIRKYPEKPIAKIAQNIIREIEEVKDEDLGDN